MANGEADQMPREIFLLYNERESIDLVARTLAARGVPIYYFRRDVPLGGNISEIEEAHFEDAPIILILLGEAGWGPTHIRYAERAREMGRPILLALVGQPPEEAFDAVGELFRTHRWIDLRNGGEAYDQLVVAIRLKLDREAGSSIANWQTDGILATIIDGSDLDRSVLLDRVQRKLIASPGALAGRLRAAILNEFSPERQLDNVFPRDPNSIPSIRSWMLSILLALEPENEATAEIASKHVDERFETSATIRFWTLVGAWQYRTSYHQKLLRQALKDQASDVASFAAIALQPESPEILSRFQTALQSSMFANVWPVLRVLRVYPIPSLATDVVRIIAAREPERHFLYDALFALANPEMAEAARPIILERMDLERFISLILQERREATEIASRAFVGILSVFDPRQVREALDRLASAPDGGPTARALRSEIEDFRTEADDSEVSAPGHANDVIDITRDSIGIDRDVRTLAAVMLARDVKPPLAIGLFGEWGAGKSFYIKSIEAAVQRISVDASGRVDSHFCANVAQIHFNAWHYVDTSLWASLVSHLLDSLSAQLNPQASPEEQRAALARELASAKDEISLARKEQALATRQLEASAVELEKKAIERERRELTLRDFQAGDLLELLNSDQALKDQVDDALAKVGAPMALQSIAELDAAVEESRTAAGRAVSFVTGIISGPNLGWVLSGISVLIVLPPAIGLAVEYLGGVRLASLSAIASQVTIIAGVIAAVLRQAVKHANAGLNKLFEAKRMVDAKLAETRRQKSARELELQAEVAEARASEKAAAERVAAATQRAQELETRVAALTDSQSLGYFVAERTKSDDYRRHLGLISTIRKDFDMLMKRIGSPKAGERGIERIVLYIDDVDRCPPDKVVDILQAVHLLLAYELFVVVVSVDPRWLLRSLGAEMAQLERTGSADDGLSATPRDYLEKIFQIPFTVRPMGVKGFGRLMEDLLAISDPMDGFASLTDGMPSRTGTQAGPLAQDPARAGSDASYLRADGQTVGSKRVPVDAWEGNEVPDPASSSVAPLSGEELPANLLAISAVELGFSQQLYRLLETPRAAKRFANIYRLLKASVPRARVPQFEGSSAVPGDFQLPMLLLALLVGQSRAAEKIFPRFLEAAGAGRGDWWHYGWEADDLHVAPGLAETLGDMAQAAYFPASPALVLDWLPRVSRFSFGTARLFIEAKSG